MRAAVVDVAARLGGHDISLARCRSKAVNQSITQTDRQGGKRGG